MDMYKPLDYHSSFYPLIDVTETYQEYNHASHPLPSYPYVTYLPRDPENSM